MCAASAAWPISKRDDAPFTRELGHRSRNSATKDTALRLPLLSVVIPTWNRSRLVCEAIESALAQRPGAVEVIVVDDGSTDDTCEVLAERFGPEIKLLRRPQRGGVRA